MKEIGKLLKKRKNIGSFFVKAWDEKSIFFAFERVIRDEYGAQGIKNLVPTYLKNKKLFVKAGSSNWKNELWASKGSIIKKMNAELNSEQIEDIKME